MLRVTEYSTNLWSFRIYAAPDKPHEVKTIFCITYTWPLCENMMFHQNCTQRKIEPQP